MATLLSTIAQTRNERASTFQAVACLYLYACGATRSLFEVLNHAGFSLSYKSTTTKIKQLSHELLEEARAIVRREACFVVWDNINIAFRVGEQRQTSKDHFDKRIRKYGANRLSWYFPGIEWHTKACKSGRLRALPGCFLTKHSFAVRLGICLFEKLFSP